MEKPPVNPGLVNCLGPCGKKFMSRDKTTNRLCAACVRKQRKLFIPRYRRFGVTDDSSQPLVFDD